jgi:SAM-dependent methyltransferase
MDAESRGIMRYCVATYGFGNGTVLDFGSYDVNGTYRDLIPGRYIGVDIIPGPNVDVLLDSPEFREIHDADAVISGQTIEHVADVPAFMAAMFGALKPGGHLVIIAPSEGPPHDYPVWVRNYDEAALREAVEAGGFEVIACTTSQHLPWKLCCCVAKKPVPITRKRKERYEDIES